MKIIYDDLYEFSEIVIRCDDTARKGKCSYCPFFDRCKIDEPENRHIQCGELERQTEKDHKTKKQIEKDCSNCNRKDKGDPACQICFFAHDPFTNTNSTPSHWKPIPETAKGGE